MPPAEQLSWRWSATAGRSRGRAPPQLGVLAADGPARRRRPLEALLLQGWLLAGLSDHAAAPRPWPANWTQAAAAGAAPLAGAAALLVRARLAEQSGDTADAGNLVDQALARLPADASALNRLRFITAQSHIRNSRQPAGGRDPPRTTRR